MNVFGKQPFQSVPATRHKSKLVPYTGQELMTTYPSLSLNFLASAANCGILHAAINRVCMGPGKPGKSWNFIASGIFQDWKVLEKGYWSWKVLEIC